MNMAIKRCFSAACFALLYVTSVLSAENLVGDKPYLHLQTGHKDSVNALAITPDSLILASGGADGNIKLWSLPDRREIYSMAAPSGSAITKINISPDGALVAFLDAYGHLNLYD